jgi:hypothetical protein
VASYHYLSDALGGLPLEYVEESPRKVWLRYRAPYWMGDTMSDPSSGPAGLAPAIGWAPFQGWHANNGAVLGNPHLVFVQTQNLLDGDPWDAGYYAEATETFPPGEGYLRRPGEWGPPFDPSRAPRLSETDWPAERRQRALRNYAVSTTMSRVHVAESVLGLDATTTLAEFAMRTVLTQFAAPLRARLGGNLDTTHGAARFFLAFQRLAGDIAESAVTMQDGEGGETVILLPRPTHWRFEESVRREVDEAFARAWDATLPLHNPKLGCQLRIEGEQYRWTFLTRLGSAAS